MLIAILNDTHCGARNSSDVFMEYQQKFYEDVFFPYLLENKIKPGLNWIVAMAVVAAVAMIIVAGYNLITSNGDPEKIQKGTKGITAAIIGLVIAFSARIILVFILEKLGLQ